MPPARTVRVEPPRVNAGAAELNVTDATSKGTFRFGVNLAPLPKKILAVPLLTGTALVSQFSAVPQLLSAPPESQTSAIACADTEPTASARTSLGIPRSISTSSKRTTRLHQM